MSGQLSMASQTNSVWYIGENGSKECGVDEASTTLKFCEWSKTLLNVIKINRGYYFNIFTISSYKDEFAVFGFIRNFQQLLPHQTNTFYIIPTSITLICLNYFGNNFNQYWSAGNNGYSELGRNTNDDKLIGLIPELTNIMIKNICAGCKGDSVFWICNDHKLYIHGRNRRYQFGLDHHKNISIPILAENIPNTSSKAELNVIEAASDQDVTIVVCNDGSAWSAGGSIWYEHGHYLEDVKKYKKINIPVKIKKVSMGGIISMFLALNGQVWGCGFNQSGALGLGHCNHISSLVRVDWFADNNVFIKDLEMGANHTIALDDKGMVYCWGDNGNGCCGIDNTEAMKVLIPTRVEYELKDVQVEGIRAGVYHTGCVTTDGDYYLWGGNKYNECCVEDHDVDTVFKPNNVRKYVFDKTKCKEILNMVLCTNTTLFLLLD